MDRMEYSVREVPLSNGGFALVDAADYLLVSQYNWNRSGKRRKDGTFLWYARTTFQQQRFSMHRFIAGAQVGQLVDHRDGDGLNNRRDNLRLCTTQQNMMNQGKTHGSSRFKGVAWHRASGKWMGVIRHNRKNIYLGLHLTEESAARAYDAKAAELFGEFARLNFQAASDLVV